MRRKLKTDIKQHDITDCAAASICSIARHYGYDIPLTAIREASGTDSLGTSVKGVLDACSALGLKAAAYRSPEKDVNALGEIGEPVILHTVNKRKDLHFIVLYGVRHGKCIIMDPAEGRHLKTGTEELRKQWSGIVITLSPDPGRAPQNTTKPKSFIKSCIGILARSRSDILLSTPGFLLAIAAGICSSVVLQHIIDAVLPSGDVKLLLTMSALSAALAVCALAATRFSSRLIIRAGTRMDAELILGYLRHLFKLPPGFFTRRGTGELNSRITDAMKVRRLLTDGISGIISSSFMLAGSIVLMFTWYWKLALLAAAFIPLYTLLFITINRANRKLNRKLVESAAEFERRCVECISSIRAIKYFGSGRAGINRIEREYCNLSMNTVRNADRQSLFGISAEALSRVLAIVIITAGSLSVFAGRLTTGELVSFYSLATLFAAPLGQMVEISGYWNEAALSLERLEDITLLEMEKEGGLETDLSEPQDIELRNVSFSYPGCGTLLKGFNLTIPKGKITAITGESGCGKSSVAALLMRDFKPQEGKILAGGTDIALLDTSEWRRYISIVPQDSSITGGTLLENITGGEAQPDLKKVSLILDELGLKEFIISLPLGILSQAGEKGCMLSGGQKQRIALARALYRDPQALILDEATASLDEESQKIILDRAKKLRDEGKTIIMITHNKDNISVADRICRM